MSSIPTAAPSALQGKLRPVLERLAADGAIAGFDEEHDLSLLAGSIPYRADFFVRTPSGKLVDVEADNPRYHSKPADDRRDEVLAVAGVSTVRLSASEIDSGRAEEKLRTVIGGIDRGRPAVAGSTRKRKVKRISKSDPHAPNVGIYLSVWHRGEAWGWCLAARKQRFSKKAGAWTPSEETMAETCGSLLEEGLARADVASRVTADRGFWAKLPRRCNLRMYGLGVDIGAAMLSSAETREPLESHNVISSQRVSQMQCKGELGLRSNFSVLASMEADVSALATTALFEGLHEGGIT